VIDALVIKHPWFTLRLSGLMITANRTNIRAYNEVMGALNYRVCGGVRVEVFKEGAADIV
jgi:hypothetical protein